MLVRPRLALAAALASACASPRARGPYSAPGGDAQPTITELVTANASRRVCRTGSLPSGWIAIAYDAASGDECPKSKRDYPIAVIVRYQSQPPSTVLDVCADQRVPPNWEGLGTAADEHCPGAAPGGGSATKRIRRLR